MGLLVSTSLFGSACDSAPKAPGDQVNAPAAVIPAATGAPVGAEAGAKEDPAQAQAKAAQAEAAEAKAAQAKAAQAKAAQAKAAEAKAAEAKAAEEAKAEEDKDKPVEPTRVLLIGDSLVATGFGVLLEKGLDKHPEVECF